MIEGRAISFTWSLLFLLLFFALGSTASAQSLFVYNQDISQFPIVKAQFRAYDANDSRQFPQASEISVSEGGVARTVLSVTCPPASPEFLLSSVLVLDVSGSMGDATTSGSVSNMDLAKKAASSWVDALGLGPNECAVTSFDNSGYLNQDFTTKRTKLLNAISVLGPQGGTDYDAGLLVPMAGALEIAKTAKHQRVIIFLTDGLPNQQPQTAAIIAEANQEGCPIFAVTVGLPCPQCLKDIATGTAGEWFENIVTADQIANVYSQILLRARDGQPNPCEISWQSDCSCTADKTNAVIEWRGQMDTIRYDPPAASIGRLVFTPPSPFFRQKLPGLKFDTSITVTANNAPFSVIGITSSNPAFDITPKSFSLAAGGSRTLTVSYSPIDSNYAWTEFDLQTNLCTQTYGASGGWPNRKATIPTVKLLQPNGGEQLLAGNDTVITWTGIPKTDSVKLEYTADGGIHWILIAERAGGGSYHWHVPGTPSTRCLVRVTQLARQAWTDWAKRFDANAKSVAIDSFGNVYVTGDFLGQVDFGRITVNQSGTRDTGFLFLAKFSPDGATEWVNVVRGDGSTGSSVAVDRFGNVFIAGMFSGSSDFGGATLFAGRTQGTSGTWYNLRKGFAAKYTADGSLVWARCLDSSNDYVEPMGIAVDAVSNLYLTGWFGYTIHFGRDSIRSAGYGDLFVVKYNQSGDPIWVKAVGTPDGGEVGNAIVASSNGDFYVAGTYGDAGQGGSAWIGRFQPNGTEVWHSTSSYFGRATGTSIGVDSASNAYLSGFCWSGTQFGAFTINGVDDDSYLAKFRPDGSVEWAKTVVPGVGIQEGAAATDVLGNSYVTGLQCFDADFGGVKLKHGGVGCGIFFCAYRPDSMADGALRAGGAVGTAMYGAEDWGTGITLDGAGNIYVIGTLADSIAAFDQDTLPMVSHDYQQMFIWKISAGGELPSDTSDAYFSILMPLPLGNDVDMRSALVGTSKDSVIQSFIQNRGTYPFRVDSIGLGGFDAQDFSLVSGIPPFIVPVASLSLPGSHPVEFDFRPSRGGVETASLTIFTQSGMFVQRILGTGVVTSLKAIGNVIDFGAVTIGSEKDTTITVALANTGGTAISVTGSPQLGPDLKQFAILSGGGAFTLMPGATQSVSLRFKPRFIGRTTGRIAFEYGGLGSPAILDLFGQGLGGMVTLTDDSGYVGERRELPMLLRNVTAASVQSVVTKYRARILYDATVLSPLTGSTQRGVRYDTATVEGALGPDSIIGRVPFLTLLGKADWSPITLVDFIWLDASGRPTDYDVETESAVFRVLGICPVGGERLINPDGDVTMSNIVPNPTNRMVHFDIQTIESGVTQLVVLNLLGQTVMTLCDGELRPGSHRFEVDASALSSGSYFLALRTPTVHRLQRFELSK